MATIMIEVGDPRRPRKWQPIELPLQPDAVYTVIPTQVLNRLGIRPYIKEEFLMRDGKLAMRQTGTAKLRYQEKIGGCDVIFGLAGIRP